MQQMPFPNILAFVEGSMEQLFFNRNFHYVRIIPIANGSSWTVDALCERMRSLFEARNFNGDRVIVWLDRENRAETAAEMHDLIKDTLAATGFPRERIAVLIGDRMTENVILADEQFIQREFGDVDYRYSCEGRGGKRVLAELYQRKNENYKELIHGVKCLKSIRLARSAKSCNSVDRFLKSLNLNCWWINGEAA